MARSDVEFLPYNVSQYCAYVTGTKKEKYMTHVAVYEFMDVPMYGIVFSSSLSKKLFVSSDITCHNTV